MAERPRIRAKSAPPPWKPDDSGVWLDIGRVSGVGVGSEFTATGADSKGQTVKLRVAELEGIARSTATVLSPPGASVAPGQIFELTKWIPAEQPPLRVWLWPSNLSQQDILAAASAVQAAGVPSVADPAKSSRGPTFSAGTAKTGPSRKAGAPTADLLGPQLSAAALKQHLPADARLWVNLPPPHELAARLIPNDPASALQLAPEMTSADYALAGVLTPDETAYAWYHKTELAAGPPASAATDHSPGCSSTSQYPVRTDWVPMAGSADLDKSSEALGKYASLLAKVHGWLALADSPADASTDNYYTLAMVPANAQAQPAAAPIGQADAPARQGDQVQDGPAVNRSRHRKTLGLRA